jgi:XTP/dITP diphosphohydrolase
MSGAGQRWVLATHNAGKLRELAEMMSLLGIDLTSAGALGLPEPEETGDTFEANAILKAEAAAIAAGMPALADDSGLAVPLLNGAPGIYSARWAGPQKDFAEAMDRVAREIRVRGGAPEGADAYFVCVLALARPNQSTIVFRGEVHGHLTFPPRGDQGFGYDPIFIAEGKQETFGEMQPVAKHSISHRAKAYAKLVDWLDAHRNEWAA